MNEVVKNVSLADHNEGVDAGRETQNFVKNLAIFAGLLVMSGAEDLPQHRFFGRG